eukprot:14474047-Ditylum_brightwellii.AAC.1
MEKVAMVMVMVFLQVEVVGISFRWENPFPHLSYMRALREINENCVCRAELFIHEHDIDQHFWVGDNKHSFPSLSEVSEPCYEGGEEGFLMCKWLNSM